MEAVNSSVSRYYPNENSPQRSLAATRTQFAAVSSNRSLEMNLVTEEGDKVTFSMDAEASAIYASHAKVGMDDESLYGQWGEFSGGQFEREITLRVEGDLNKQERREIRKVLKTINRMMRNFVQGNLNPMTQAKAQKLQGLETIDRLDVEMSYERTVVVAQQTQAAVSYDRTGDVIPMDGRGTANAVAPHAKDETKALAQGMAKEVVNSQAPKDPLMELADRLLKAHRDQAAKWNPNGGRLVDHIREMFQTAVEALGHRSPVND